MVSRRDFLRSAAAGAITMALPQTLFSKTKETDKPNIILCMVDDMGWGDPGFNGNSIIKTPNLDEWQKQECGLRVFIPVLRYAHLLAEAA